jgi:tripartite-type tricarboxylate transporter receptor subunit TctC
MTARFRPLAALRLVLLGTLGALSGTVHAAESPYPSRPVRLVIPFAPGGGLDVLARILSPKLHESTGQIWVVDNRAGAAGNLGSEITARSNPDGYTALVALSTPLTVNPHLYKLPFSVEKDLQAVTLLAMAEHMVIVHPSVPVKNFAEFLDLVRAKPGALNYASAGVGSSIHMAAELLKLRTGINLVHVPYKGGGPAAAAVLAGESQVMVGTVASAIGFINAGRLKPLAATGPKRSRVLPDLPTVAESGYPGFDADAWFGLFVAAGTPRARVDRMRSEILKALQHPEVQATMGKQGMTPITTTPEELADLVKRETAQWAAVVKQAGIKAE